MTVTALEYEDRQRRWKLKRTELGPFNLLVGVSGAGKTSVLNALLEVSVMGMPSPGARHPGGERQWCIEIQADSEHTYRWEATVAVQAGTTAPRHDTLYEDFPWPVRFVQERITLGDGRSLVVRSPEEFRFQDNKLPKITTTESAISLLQEEPLVAPLYRALERIIDSPTDPDPTLDTVEQQELASVFLWTTDSPAFKGGEADVAEKLRAFSDIPVLLKAYLARQYAPGLFAHICDQYLQIFDNVAELTVDRASKLDARDGQHADGWPEDAITVAIKERDTDAWITGEYISSGMLRTFFHIAELEFAPRGTTIVIDEYENSMGVNCLPAITDLFLRRQHELQFVLTSHHPYVIQNIPIDWWRVVTRRGGVVSVRPASEIPELNTRSRHDAFTLLVNSSVYEEGIQ
ncbi:MAG TPA: AAA family ATPase [Haliangium sp.]|nr:AAA family ATPase [Haliangium sp.]